MDIIAFLSTLLGLITGLDWCYGKLASKRHSRLRLLTGLRKLSQRLAGSVERSGALLRWAGRSVGRGLHTGWSAMLGASVSQTLWPTMAKGHRGTAALPARTGQGGQGRPARPGRPSPKTPRSAVTSGPNIRKAAKPRRRRAGAGKRALA
ncbi:MAG: hypothetical protein AAFR17_17830 [Pseudomonadota bacterium]